jgi:hypothetical protein
VNSLAPSSSGRWWAAISLAVVAVVLLAMVERESRALFARFGLPTGAAQWIWEPRDRRDLSPAAFYAARDFTLERPPARARILAGGDEELILYLNGARVGTGGWRPGAPLDVWEVGPLLQPGGNRLLVEMRSGRGTGGLLVSLEDESGESGGGQLVASDATWRIFHRHALGLLRGWLPLTGDSSPPSVPAVCLGFPPLGRWGRPRPGAARPLFADLVSGRPAPASSSSLLPPLAMFPTNRPQPPRRLFDFGREVTGHLLLDAEPAPEKDGKQMGLVWVGGAPPDPLRQHESAGVVLLPGRRTWMDAFPRRFRYALVMGFPGTLGARVQEVDAARVVLTSPGPPQPPRGVLGIVPPPLRTPVEDEIWRQLEPARADRNES